MKIVAVTACIAGLAHTYMAKANLEKYAQKYGYEIKVEMQGAMGIENRLEQEEIDNADVVIFAVDTNVNGRDRFQAKPIYSVSTHDVVLDGDKTIREALALIK